jgi:Cu2+-exporting ATPase
MLNASVSTVDIVLFDKTGTMTKGSHVVRDAAAVDGDTDRFLALVTAAESDSAHPLVRAIVNAARERGSIPTASGFRSMSGRWVEATVEAATIAVGGPAFLARGWI